MKKFILLAALTISAVISGRTSISSVQQIKEPIRLNEAKSSTLISLGQVKTKGSNLNVRAKPSTSSSLIGKLPNNTFLEIYDSSDSWFHVKFSATKKGYVSKNYIEIVSENIKTVKASALNIRSSSSTSSSKIGQLANGSSVGVLSTSNGWSKIVYSGTKTGFVSAEYLIGGDPEETIKKYPALKLNVPSYKQFDERWANLKLGGSTTTFKKSGCTTSALAMTESYRQGKTITPLDYSKTVKYTSGGAIYWPSNYKVDTSSSNYLSKIYDLLKNNKPSVIGLKNKAGKQHYVTIVGYKGGDSLTSSGFLINDPGSSSRTILSEVLASHPNFYKLVSAK